MEACLNGRKFGNFLCLWRCAGSEWRSLVISPNSRLHLLTEASKYHPRQKDHPAHPGGSAIGLLWGYALDGEERPVWEVRPDKAGWQLQHVHGARYHPLTSQSGHRAHCFWPLHRVYAYDAFSLRPVLNDPKHFEASQHQSPDSLLPSPSSLLHRHRDVRDENPVASNAPPSTGHTDLLDEADVITIGDSDASLIDTGVHWDLVLIPPLVASSSRVILRGLKRKMEPRRWQQVSFVIMQRNRPLRDITLRLRNWRASATA